MFFIVFINMSKVKFSKAEAFVLLLFVLVPAFALVNFIFMSPNIAAIVGYMLFITLMAIVTKNKAAAPH